MENQGNPATGQVQGEQNPQEAQQQPQQVQNNQQSAQQNTQSQNVQQNQGQVSQQNNATNNNNNNNQKQQQGVQQSQQQDAGNNDEPEVDPKAYETRFKEFIKKKFGGLIGEMLLDNELKQLNVNDLASLDKKKQLEIMEAVLNDIFKKHKMDKAQNQTRFEMYLQLALDDAIQKISSAMNDDVDLSAIEITHHNEKNLDKFVGDNLEEKFWDIKGKLSGDVEGDLDIIIPDTKLIILITSYAKSKNVQFNPLDGKQKQSLSFELLNIIFDSIMGSLKELITLNSQYSLESMEEVNIDLVNDIKKNIDKMTEKKGKRADIVSAHMTATMKNQDIEMDAHLTY